MRRVLVVLIGVLLLMLIPGTAFAAASQPRDDSLVVLNGDANVAADETVDSVVVFNGATRIDGTVRDTVVAFSGPVVITGTVDGDVLVFDGLLTVQDGAHISGDVFADRRAISPDAQVDGTIESTVRFAWAAGWASWAVWLAFVLVVALSLFLLGLLMLWIAPRGMDAVVEAGRTAVGPSIGWGAALLFGLPVVAVIAMVTVVGLPLGFGLLFALGLIYSVGLVAGSWFLGRQLMKSGSRVGAFAIGWAIVTAASLFPGIGALAWLAATGYGLGTICVAVFRARRGPSEPIRVPEMPSTPVKV